MRFKLLRAIEKQYGGKCCTLHREDYSALRGRPGISSRHFRWFPVSECNVSKLFLIQAALALAKDEAIELCKEKHSY